MGQGFWRKLLDHWGQLAKAWGMVRFAVVGAALLLAFLTWLTPYWYEITLVVGGAGGVLLVSVVGMYWTRLISGLKAIPGIWTYVRTTAIGTVPVRYTSAPFIRIPTKEWSVERVRKGKTHQLRFSPGPMAPSKFAIEIPSFYRLDFSAGELQIKWDQKEPENGWRRYEGTEQGFLWHDSGGRPLFVSIELGTKLFGPAGWTPVRRSFRENSWCTIAARGRYVATAPDHPEESERYRRYLALMAYDRKDDPLEPKPPIAAPGTG